MTSHLALSARAERARQLTVAALASGDVQRLDDLVSCAARELEADGANLSMLTDRQVTAASSGAEHERAERGTQTPFDDTICANVLRTDRPLAIADTSLDSRVSSVPAVQEGLVGAYLGVPLRLDGGIVGVLCVFDAEPREWTAENMTTLAGLARQVLAELQRLE